MTALLHGPDIETPRLTRMTKAELLAYATTCGIHGVSSAMRKADILAAVEKEG